MQNSEHLLSQFIPNLGGNAGKASGLLDGKKGLATGLVTGGLAGLLMGNKKSRKMAKTAAKYGGAAVLGGLAYKAYNTHKQQRGAPAAATAHTHSAPQPNSAAPQPAGAATGIDFFEADDTNALHIPLILKAMVAAASADGHIDTQEKARIGAKLRTLDIAPEHRQFINEQLASPLSPQDIAFQTSSEEEARHILSACDMMLDSDNAADQAFHQELIRAFSQRLLLPAVTA